MKVNELSNFRLVGGTALSLQLGHRMSIDIDLFTDQEYGSVDFISILETLKTTFPYIDHGEWSNRTFGNSCFLGDNENQAVKLDLFYTETYLNANIIKEDVRMASLEDIAAMKLDVIGRGGRKKDFWDIHALLSSFSLDQMLEIYSKKYPYNFSNNELIEQLVKFENAETDPDPICLEGKYWELIKLDFLDETQKFK